MCIVYSVRHSMNNIGTFFMNTVKIKLHRILRFNFLPIIYYEIEEELIRILYSNSSTTKTTYLNY